MLGLFKTKFEKIIIETLERYRKEKKTQNVVLCIRLSDDFTHPVYQLFVNNEENDIIKFSDIVKMDIFKISEAAQMIVFKALINLSEKDQIPPAHTGVYLMTYSNEKKKTKLGVLLYDKKKKVRSVDLDEIFSEENIVIPSV